MQKSWPHSGATTGSSSTSQHMVHSNSASCSQQVVSAGRCRFAGRLRLGATALKLIEAVGLVRANLGLTFAGISDQPQDLEPSRTPGFGREISWEIKDFVFVGGRSNAAPSSAHCAPGGSGATFALTAWSVTWPPATVAFTERFMHAERGGANIYTCLCLAMPAVVTQGAPPNPGLGAI